MKKYVTLFLLGGMLLSGVSCKKDSNESAPDTGSNAPVFVGKRWAVESILIQPAIDLDGDGKPDPDLVPLMDACNQDDSVVFQADGKVIEDHGTALCDDDNNAKTKHAYNWTYNAAAKKINLADATNPADVTTWEVLEASNSTLKVHVTILPDDGKNGALNATMTMKAR